ncbi:hypothetical protein [Streptomyces syringium]|uniref:hypothetical protein n=1 Tax=Streptomyces syringium TaxID=76729 RepID=UPI0033CB39EF
MTRLREPLAVKKIAVMVPPCDTGQHYQHPAMTCEEAEAWIAHTEATIRRGQ